MSKPLDRFFYGNSGATAAKKQSAGHGATGRTARTPKPDGEDVLWSAPGDSTAGSSRTRTNPGRGRGPGHERARSSAPRSPRTPRPAKPARPAAPRPWRRLPVASSVKRLRAMLIAVAVVFSLAAGRAVQVQAIDADAVAAEAAEQITVAHVLPAFRGQITDRNGEVLAYTEDTVTVVADPEMIRTNGKFDDPMNARDTEVAATAAQQIADLLVSYAGGSAADYLGRLTKPGSKYSVVARNVSAAAYGELISAMNEAGLIGIHRESAPTRRYPNGTVASNVVGFVNAEGVGSGGLELALDKTLKGIDGEEAYETSPNGKIPLGTSVLTPARNGQDYQLTLDLGLQWEVEQVLADRVRKAEANSGVVVVMNVKTGEILALANFPSYDPNDYGSYNTKDLGNRAITDVYTPGSVQKTLTFAAMLDAGIVRPDDIVKVPGKVRSGDNWVADAWAHGELTYYARGVLAKSSNVGTILLARQMKKADLQRYLTSFGLGSKTGVGLPGESAGILPGPDMPDYSRDGLAFGGSAVAVTAVQEAAAVAAVTNGGVYHQPRIIAASTDTEGAAKEFPTAEPRRVISEEASKEVVSLMEAMVVNNSSGVFPVDGYRTGAKTGTSQKLDPKTGRTTGLVTSTIGVGPVEDPQLLVYVVVDNPRRGASGQSVAGPAYQDIMQLALARYGVAPSTSKPPKLPVGP
ncbi:MAG: penicillin-binding protein 2 [Propionicimonas sp.]|uniref:peptidoglycan D,D-transpeptidase FtsI family protein n=1 Tax=Propionicimonas sp. TaxID=1955623 RepID=UPI002B1FB75C|nr:penicillin-binding protein 2 [Propionicimonas sp.]MEA4943013.1 penicillin-binding protein 2 [Propionicimonas sp.]